MRALIVALLLSGCAQMEAASRPVRGLDGAQAYEVKCTYEAECVKRGADLCPGGFSTLENQAGIYGVTLLVQCD